MNKIISEHILPVAIMAHNEEKVISRAIQSCFAQMCPADYIINVFIVANGCTDATEDIVTAMSEQYGNRLKLSSMKEKGKTIALNRAIEYFEKETIDNAKIPYVIFMDADCEFIENDVMVKFIKRFEDTPSLCAVGATNVPKKIRSPESNLVSDMYQATNELNKLLPENGISGGAYCIKRAVLRDFRFPEIQMADDMYMSMKLDGWMFRDKDIAVYYTIPENLNGELKKRIRHEIAILRYHEYYFHLLKSGSQTALYDRPLDDKYRWTGFSTLEVLSKLFKVDGLKSKCLICLSIFIRLMSKKVAHRKHEKIKNNPEYDYWHVER